jgi:hypothetical protein
MMQLTRAEALKEADTILESLIASGDERIFASCRGADGKVDQGRMISAALRAREKLADSIMADGGPIAAALPSLRQDKQSAPND